MLSTTGQLTNLQPQARPSPPSSALTRSSFSILLSEECAGAAREATSPPSSQCTSNDADEIMTTAHSHSPPPPHRAGQHVTSTSKSATSNQKDAPLRSRDGSNSSGTQTIVAADGSVPVMAPRPGLNGIVGGGPSNGETSRFAYAANGANGGGAVASNEDDDRRPTTAPGRRDGQGSNETRDDIGSGRALRPNKPLLLRSKSEYKPRQVEEHPEPADEQIQDWGARHGFEEHYQSEQVMQLANVSSPPHG